MIKKFISDGIFRKYTPHADDHFHCEGHNFEFDFYLDSDNPLYFYLVDLLNKKVVIKIEIEEMENED